MSSICRLEKVHLKEKETNLRQNEYFIFSPTAFSNDCIFTLNRGYARIYIYAINMNNNEMWAWLNWKCNKTSYIIV